MTKCDIDEADVLINSQNTDENNTITNFFLWCAGTSTELLKSCKEDDIVRQEQLGAHVFLTAVLALFSTFVALTYAFDDYWIILIFSSLWSISIFLLDRTLIISPILTYKHTSKDKQFVTAWGTLSIRLVLAALLGIFIATPFELKIFSHEIETHIAQSIKIEQIRKIDQSIANLKKLQTDTEEDYKKQIKSTEALQEIELGEQIDSLKSSRDKKEKLRENEYQGITGSGIRGAGDRYKQLTKEITDIDAEIKEKGEQKISLATKRQFENTAILKNQTNDISRIEGKINILVEEKNSLNTSNSVISTQEQEAKLQVLFKQRQDKTVEIDNSTTENSTVLKNELEQLDKKIRATYTSNDGKNNAVAIGGTLFSLLTRIEALATLQENNEKIRQTCWVVFLVFMIFEIIPILAKFFFKGSNYDYLMLVRKRKAETDARAKFAKAIEQDEKAKRTEDATQTQTKQQQQYNKEMLDSMIFKNAMKEEHEELILQWRNSTQRKRAENIGVLEKTFEAYFKESVPQEEFTTADDTQQNSNKSENNTSKIVNSSFMEGIKKFFEGFKKLTLEDLGKDFRGILIIVFTLYFMSIMKMDTTDPLNRSIFMFIIMLTTTLLIIQRRKLKLKPVYSNINN